MLYVLAYITFNYPVNHLAPVMFAVGSSACLRCAVSFKRYCLPAPVAFSQTDDILNLLHHRPIFSCSHKLFNMCSTKTLKFFICAALYFTECHIISIISFYGLGNHAVCAKKITPGNLTASDNKIGREISGGCYFILRNCARQITLQQLPALPHYF
jgi:hypothetical protein